MKSCRCCLSDYSWRENIKRTGRESKTETRGSSMQFMTPNVRRRLTSHLLHPTYEYRPTYRQSNPQERTYLFPRRRWKGMQIALLFAHAHIQIRSRHFWRWRPLKRADNGTQVFLHLLPSKTSPRTTATLQRSCFNKDRTSLTTKFYFFFSPQYLVLLLHVCGLDSKWPDAEMWPHFSSKWFPHAKMTL